MSERIRGRKGAELRRRRLAAEPLCRMCKAKGIIRASVTPDHILALAKGGTDTDGNIQCLCSPCHAEKTALDFGHRVRRAVSLDGWPE